MLSNELSDLLNLPPRTSGYIVKTVAKDSPGDHVGLRGSNMLVQIAGQEVPLGGDIILGVNGISASAQNLAKIRESIGGMASGAPFTVTVLRAGQVMELTGKAP